jgi:RNA recognition motif-containing protein
MAQRKSTAQLKRLQKRAEQRGESYELAMVTTTTTTTTTEEATKKVAILDGNNKKKENNKASSSAADAAAGSPSGATTKINKVDHREEENDDIEETQQKEQPANKKRAIVNNAADHQQQETSSKKQEPKDVEEQKSTTNSSSSSMMIAAVKRKVAMELQKELQAIEANPELKAKDRRSAKRKAEAIAVEQTGGGATSSAQELLDWLATYNSNTVATDQEEDVSANKSNKKKMKTTTSTTKPNKSSSSRTPTPNILFIGQLSFDTTKEEILACFRKHLVETEKMKVANDALSVRLLTHAQTGKSKGMAFLEIRDADQDPLIVYSCLKLHHTYIKGRRINVERTSGGGKATKQTKVATLRQHQVDYMKETVQSILKEYDTSSLDAGVLALCERHNATVVHAGMERFVETNGPDKENPSAYLTALLHKLATEGIYDRTKPKNNDKDDHHHEKRYPSKTGRSSNSGGSHSRDNNIRRRTPDTAGRIRPGGGSNNRGRR